MPDAMTSTGRPSADLKISDLAISATVQPTAAAASSVGRVKASNCRTWNSGPSAACTLSALGAVAGFISQRPRHQLLHDLRGAGVDAVHACVRIGARDRIFHHVAVAAE